MTATGTANEKDSSQSQQNEQPDEMTQPEDDAKHEPQPDPRENIEKELLPFIDSVVRELVKQKLIPRPKGGTKKEQKVKDMVDICMLEDKDHVLEHICHLMVKHDLVQTAQDLQLLVRPPPGKSSTRLMKYWGVPATKAVVNDTV